MDDIDYKALTDKIGDLTRLTIKQEKALIRQAGKIRGYKKSIKQYKLEIEMLTKQKNKNKQHYKNGKRGSRFNG
ncbi:MAG: hypothetical protein K0S80_2336 [Neobacillus sp.]|nr:hypothetical protein [Neobacillus sp.]